MKTRFYLSLQKGIFPDLIKIAKVNQFLKRSANMKLETIVLFLIFLVLEHILEYVYYIIKI